MSNEEIKANTVWLRILADMVHGGLLRDLEGGELKTYLAVKVFADLGTGQARPTIRKIAELTGLSDRTVKRHIGRLRELSLLSVMEDARRNNTYELFEAVRVLDSSGEESSRLNFQYVPNQLEKILSEIRDSIGKNEIPSHPQINVTLNFLGQGMQVNQVGCDLSASEIRALAQANGLKV